MSVRVILPVPLLFIVWLNAAHRRAAQKEAYNLGLPARTYGTFRSEAKRIEKRLENSAAAAGPGKKEHPSKICIVCVTLARDCSMQA